ncbi:MAG: NAD(P)H-binding protein [Ignavibacteriaceae bacterium]|nr:NAD(P)H-binding protein [Ignavibacteriaceae bacterium]
MKTAIVIGATGLVGKCIVNHLIHDDRYNVIKVFTRRTLNLVNPKLQEYLVDFDMIKLWKDKIRGDDLFSAMGTTIKQAGSQEKQLKVDFHYQYEFAKAACENGVNKYLLVSSAGANSKSSNFYLRIKGELDDKIIALSFNQIFIFRPSILVGQRDIKRFQEDVGIKLMKYLTKFIPLIKKYRPIEATTVAKAMIESANSNILPRLSIFELDQIFNV